MTIGFVLGAAASRADALPCRPRSRTLTKHVPLLLCLQLVKLILAQKGDHLAPREQEELRAMLLSLLGADRCAVARPWGQGAE